MKFYRLHKIHEAGVSAGFEFFTTYRAAARAYHEWIGSDEDSVPDTEGTKIELISIDPRKTGILRALNRYASHPNNG